MRRKHYDPVVIDLFAGTILLLIAVAMLIWFEVI
jgi:hypothetical protein